MINPNPAEKLLDEPILSNGWIVSEKLPRSELDTGGNFSVGYTVSNGQGRTGFLKALDFSAALTARDTDVPQVLANEINAYLYERDLLYLCRDNNLDHVAASIDDGIIPAGVLHELLPVPYLIFDLADGDIRSKLDLSKRFELAFCLRALHNSAVGLNQLHSHSIAHQDLKPSNVLVFGNSHCRVSDLGRSAHRDRTAPTNDCPIPGDPIYAPPELHYGSISSEWSVGKVACDLYHLGSLAVFFFTKVGMTSMWIKHISPVFYPRNWTQTYREVLPYVRAAHELAFDDFEQEIPLEIRDSLGESVRQLCDPDPSLRGHPRNKETRGNPYALQRYISRFDFLARRAEWQMKRSFV